MERRTCKLCSRTFANGRALGGHMRSHMALLLPSQKTQVAENEPPSSCALSSSSSSSSSSEEEEEEEEEGSEKAPYYGLRENPQKSFRLADPEFSFAVDAGSVVQDRESETESSKHPHRRRSKRYRKSADSASKTDAEPEPASSVSDATTEEDVALCLMMLSRDTWTTESRKSSEEEEDEVEAEAEADEEEHDTEVLKGRNRYQCETCKKVFRSYQALGGHRSSHKKIRVCGGEGERAQVGSSGTGDRRRIHQCPVCFRVFSSGQALGGHKRSHFTGAASPPPPSHFGDHLIDLNLPAPAEDDMVELSAVSDAGFAVNPAK